MTAKESLLDYLSRPKAEFEHMIFQIEIDGVIAATFFDGEVALESLQILAQLVGKKLEFSPDENPAEMNSTEQFVDGQFTTPNGKLVRGSITMMYDSPLKAVAYVLSNERLES